MSATTSIEWTEATWNPVTGCDWVSPGCDHCYARTLAKRMKAMGNVRYQNDGYDKALKQVTPGFGLTLHEDKLTEPLKWKQPRVVFVNSMSDLFHPDVPLEFIAKVFAVMGLAQQHTFQVLTKRPRRMRDIWSEPGFGFLYEAAVDEIAGNVFTPLFPLPNVWLGTSVENQEWADKRVPLLADTLAIVRFLSCEPLLGPVTIPNLNDIDWVIVGGESGPNHRPMDPQWARDIRDQCTEAGVAYFFKQHGGRTPKANGRELDGRTWDEMPERVA